MKLPEFYAQAMGIEFRSGSERCCFCGSLCDASNLAKNHVKPTFTSRDTIRGGDYVCDGCVATMDQKATIRLACGEVRENQKSQLYSYVITATKVIAATKAHRQWLLDQCLSPPDPPFAISISDSGQKHLLYLGVVNRKRDVIQVTLEGESIRYRPTELSNRLNICMRIAAVLGKPSLRDQLNIIQLGKLFEVYGDDFIVSWMNVREQPLTNLAIWLTPKKEECINELGSTNDR